MKNITEQDYIRYIGECKRQIKEYEQRSTYIDNMRKISKLTFEDFVRFQNGEKLEII